MRLLRPIAALAPVSTKLAADGRRVSVHDAGNVALHMSGFEKDGSLVSFVSGEMCVVHLGNFDLAVEVLGCYCISPTQPVNQSCTSNLNSRNQKGHCFCCSFQRS